MLLPAVVTRMKQIHDVAGARVRGIRSGTLGEVAGATGKGKVRGVVGAAAATRDNVLNVEAVATDALWRTAVLAPAVRALLDSSARRR